MAHATRDTIAPPAADRPVPAVRAGSASRRMRRDALPYILLAPTVITVVAVIVYPVITAIQLSFQRVRLPQPGAPPAPYTLDNYVNLFATSALGPSVRVTLIYVLVSTAGAFILGLATALMLDRDFRGRALARMLVALPWAIPIVVATNIWAWIFDQSFGVANWALLSTHVIGRPIAWTQDIVGAMVAVSAVTIWKGYPFFFIMLLAGLQAIPRELYEAVRVDGAGAWAAFRHITLPGLRHVMAIATLLGSLWVFREFTAIYVLTAGGPVRATETLAIWTYREAFANFNMGFAAAVGMLTLLISAISSVVLIRLTHQEFY